MWIILRSFCKTSSYWTASDWWPDCHPSRYCQPNGSSPCIARSLVRRTSPDSCRTSQNRRKCWARSSKCWARLSSWLSREAAAREAAVAREAEVNTVKALLKVAWATDDS